MTMQLPTHICREKHKSIKKTPTILHYILYSILVNHIALYFAPLFEKVVIKNDIYFMMYIIYTIAKWRELNA